MPLVMRRLTILASGLDHPGAIAIQSKGTIWTSGEAGQIYQISPDGKRIVQVAIAPETVTSLAIAPGESWLAVGHNAGLSRLDLGSNDLVAIPAFVGVVGGLCFMADGKLLVTERSRPAKGRLMAVDGEQVSDCKVGALNDPRGLALSGDGRSLFVVCREMPGVMICGVEEGLIGKAKEFALLPNALPEGIAIDHRANMYVSCHAPTRVYKVAPDKWVTNHIEDPRMEVLSQPAGLAWTGKGFDQLIVANRGARHLTQMDMQQIGLGAVNQR